MAGYGKEVPQVDKAGRFVLTELVLLTIDVEDARDFDDAVYAEAKDNGGWRLWVAIADVSAYVLPYTVLDNTAIERGNSVYFPDHVVPMLPEALSNGLCSLNPHTDRLCLVADMHISASGKLDSYQFYEAVMHSSARLTYNKVHKILQGDPELRQQYAANLTNIETLNSLYKKLAKVRGQRGAIEFETVETRFVFNSHRKIEQIVPVHRVESHKIIEECMIMANVAAARFIEKHEAHTLFRVHERPDADRFDNFRRFLAELGIEANLSAEPTPLELTQTLEKIGDRPDRELIETTMLRSMKQAVYQGDNQGHFGLALEAYAHFTSPIRRYPDLVLHRGIKALLAKQGQKVTGAREYTEAEITPLGEQCSMTERRADDAGEREIGLDDVRLEIFVEIIGNRHGPEAQRLGHFVRAELAEFLEGVLINFKQHAVASARNTQRSWGLVKETELTDHFTGIKGKGQVHLPADRIGDDQVTERRLGRVLVVEAVRRDREALVELRRFGEDLRTGNRWRRQFRQLRPGRTDDRGLDGERTRFAGTQLLRHAGRHAQASTFLPRRILMTKQKRFAGRHQDRRVVVRVRLVFHCTAHHQRVAAVDVQAAASRGGRSGFEHGISGQNGSAGQINRHPQGCRRVISDDAAGIHPARSLPSV